MGNNNSQFPAFPVSQYPMILQVHDELLFEVPAGEAEKLKEKIVKIMDNVIQISVPVTAQANIGNNWGEIH